ncbi:hypothetical protein [Streptomyces venezuelae]|uniref:hypothetical protein n=1 Tax=Streptomyces venezuelae TaxID=54571 RepID=UPI001238FAFB|nr:hypothetical protein [Streptomyces venezuelae]
MSDDRTVTGTGAPPEVRRASHVTDDSDVFVELCANALSETGLHHVAQYRWGVFGYSVDILDRLPEAQGGGFGGSGGKEQDVRRERFVRLGRQLHYVLGRMDHVLRSVDSGKLIRSVLQVGDGAVFHYYFRADDCLTGVSLGADTVDAGDRAMAELVGAFRQEIGLPLMNPGGFDSETSLPVIERTPLALSKEPHRVVEGEWGTTEPALLEHCVEAVSPDTLHYAGYVAPGTGRLSADVFNDPELSRFFGGSLTRDERRTRYTELGERLHYVVARLNQSLRAVMPGKLSRVVLDVEEGALFYVDRPDDHFLLGVTLDQSQVARADRRMNDLVHQVTRTDAEPDAEPNGIR